VLKRLQRDLGITTIYVTHDQEEAQSLADKIVVMHEGHIQQTGSPKEVYDNPVNAFVAGFIGTPPMNFIRCRLAQDNGETVLVGPENFRLPLAGALASQLQSLPVDTEVILGIRPERIALSPQADPSLPVGRVHTIEPEGNEVVVSVRLGELIWKARASNDQLNGHLERDMTVYLQLEQSKIHLFDPDSGQRLTVTQT
jgi:multiple sugar transport system ATP-binding protein